VSKNNLLKIQEFGQSIWLDYISRGMIHSDELKRLIEEDGLRGVTSNPSIFDQAFEGSQDYEEAIRALSQEGKTAEEIYQALTVEDVQMAADEFRHLYDASEGTHGFVSLEVNPHLAYRTEETMAEARELWRSLDRPNVFIKVPATKEGLPAIEQLISEGINVNVTLLFGLPRYREVAAAYIAGLEERAAAGKPVDRVRSVASFFLSRIDVLVDPKLEEIMAGKGSKAETAQELHGQVAIASAKEAYQIYKGIFGHERFQRLAYKGGRPQRVLWASTSAKNPDYSEVKYVEPLIGPETINTLPQETLKAYRDHGNPEERLEQGLEEARKVLELLPEVDMDIDQVTQQLEKEGVGKFIKPYDRLMDTLAKKQSQALEKKSQAQKAAPGG
jgi:transaldolase